jgi:hypothetical protein
MGLSEGIMETYVAEIDGRAIFAFRSVDVSCAQAWLDIHGLMRRSLARLESGGHTIWNGRSEIVARKATLDESAIWTSSSDRAAGEQRIDEPDYVLVWLIPVSAEPPLPEPRQRRARQAS